MRTTITLEQDVAEKAKTAVATLGRPFKQVINEALRIGLAHLERPPVAKPYRSVTYPMGLRPGLNLHNIADLLAQVEGEDYR